MLICITSQELTYVIFVAFCTPEIGGRGRDTNKTSNKNTIAYYCFKAPKILLLISLCLTYFIGDDKLKISVNDDFPIEDFFGKDSNQKLVFKEGNKVRPLGSDVKLSNGMKAGFAVVLNKRGGKNLGNGKV